MNIRYLFLGILLSSIQYFLCAQSDFNLDLVAQVNQFDTVSNSIRYNDIWGYVDAEGREYAILGVRGGTAIYSLEDPSQPELLEYIKGAFSIWRDMKSFGRYIYVVADQGQDGILVIDMAQAPASIDWEFYNVPAGDLGAITTCHNIFIDENGFAYLSGCNINRGGVLIFDLHDENGIPEYAGAADDIYSHDNYVRGDTIYSADIFEGFFSVIDATDKNSPITLATQPTSRNFTHNCWLSDNGRYLFTTDERANAFIDAYDIGDLGNIRRLDAYRPKATEGQGVFPHNVHVHNDYLVISYYTDGVKIVDASKPDNLIEVGSYDTFEGPAGSDGCWGAYPFLPSGLVLASDMQSGLFVFRPNYQHACRLEGSITNAEDGSPLAGTRVEILSEQINGEETDGNGNFKIGQAHSGTFDVILSKPGFTSKTVEVELENGQTTILNASLSPREQINVSGTVTKASDGSPVANAIVHIENADFTYTAMTNHEGIFTLNNIFNGNYLIIAGKWGFLHSSKSENLLPNASINLQLEEGYQDDFVLEQGWTVTGNAASGTWQRGKPVGTSSGGLTVTPGTDVEGDLGAACFVTGNRGGDVGNDDVDDGFTLLSSPSMDLTTYTDPMLHLSYWFVNTGGGNPPNDFLELLLTNEKGDTASLIRFTDSEDRWKNIDAIPLATFLELSAQMQLHALTQDLPETGNLVEAGIDAFLITEGTVSKLSDQSIPGLTLKALPNPFGESVRIQIENNQTNGPLSLRIFDIQGQLLELRTLSGQVSLQSLELGRNWPAGTYSLWLSDRDGHSNTLRLLKSGGQD